MKAIAKFTILVVGIIITLVALTVWTSGVFATTIGDWRVDILSEEHGLTHHEVIIEIQNFDNQKQNFNLGFYLSNTTFNISDVSEVIISEQREEYLEYPTYDWEIIDEDCWDLRDDITNESYTTPCMLLDICPVNATNYTYDCSYNRTYEDGSDWLGTLVWHETHLSDMIDDGHKSSVGYGKIEIPRYESPCNIDDFGTEFFCNGTRLFKIEWETPLEKTGKGWGSIGYFAITEDDLGLDFDPWWNATWTYKKQLNLTEEMSVNITQLPVTFWFNHEGNANSICSDIRLLDSAEENEIDFGLQGCNDTHVELALQANFSADEVKTYYVYYGNTSAVTWGNVTWEEARYNLFDDFEDGDISDWGDIGGIAFVNDTVPYAGSYALEMVGAGTTNIVDRDWLSGLGGNISNVTAEFWARTTDTTGYKGYCVDKFAIWFFNGGDIKCIRDAGWCSEAIDFSANIWYNFTYTIKNNATFDYYVNGTLISDDEPRMSDYSGNVQQVYLRGDNSEHLLMDDVKVYQTMTTMPSATLGDEETDGEGETPVYILNLTLNATLNANETYTYPEAVAVVGTANDTGVTVYRDGVDVGNETIVLGVAEYNYTIVSDNNTTGITDIYAIIGQGTPTATLTNNESWTEDYETAISIGMTETNGGDDDCTYNVWRDTTDLSTGEDILLGAGTYDYKINVTGCTNWTDTDNLDPQTMTINQLDANVVMSPATGSNTYGNLVTQICSDDSVLLDCDIYRNDTSVPNNTADIYAADVYYYVANITDDTNYTNYEDTSTYTINQAASAATMYFNGTIGDHETTYYPNSTINVTAVSNVSDLYVQLWRNDTLIQNATDVATDIRQWGAATGNFSAVIQGNQNYSDSELMDLWWNVSTGTPDVNISWTNGIIYGTAGDAQINDYSDGDDDVTYDFYRNRTDSVYVELPVSSPDTTVLAAGTYEYTIVITGGENYSSGNITIGDLTVLKADTAVDLLLNGTDGNVGYDQYEIANFTATTNATGQTINITSNITGWVDVTDTTTVINYTNLTAIGVFNITGYSVENENFSASYETHYASTSDATPPTITWVDQYPADLTAYNIFIGGDYLHTNYTITDVSGIDNTTVLLFYKTNNTADDTTYYENGTAYSGWFNTTYNVLSGSEYNFTIFENQVYPATHNIELMNYSHSHFNLSNPTEYAKIRLFNVSNSKQFSFFEIMANTSGSQALRIYYCNSSYITGAVPDNDNCAQFYTLDSSATYNHSHYTTGWSSHHVIPFGINTTTGQVNGIDVTPTSYFLLRGAPGVWSVYYITNVTRADQIQNSTNNGAAWTNVSGTIDAHLHQYNGDDTLYYYVYAEDTVGNGVNSTLKSDEIDEILLPPTAPDVYSPESVTLFNNTTTVWINYTQSVSPSGSEIDFYNISLLNSDESFNKTIYTNNSLNLSYLWDYSSTNAGEYYIKVEVTDNETLSSYGLSENFTINATEPTISQIYVDATCLEQLKVYNFSWTQAAGNNGTINESYATFEVLPNLWKVYSSSNTSSGSNVSSTFQTMYNDTLNVTVYVSSTDGISLSRWTTYTVWADSTCPGSPVGGGGSGGSTTYIPGSGAELPSGDTTTTSTTVGQLETVLGFDLEDIENFTGINMKALIGLPNEAKIGITVIIIACIMSVYMFWKQKKDKDEEYVYQDER